MQLTRIQIALCILALSACAGIDKQSPAPAPDISLRPDTALAGERKKAPDTAGTRGNPVARRTGAYLPGKGLDNSVYFSDDDARVDEGSQDLLRRHAVRLKDNPQQVVTLIGYTDPFGSRSYNLAITEERLDSVAEILRSLGVARSQIRRVSTGQARTAGRDCGNDPGCRQQMQRVELIYEN